VSFTSFAVPRVRGVWKLDVLRPDGRALDSKKREGGWGRIASLMRQDEGAKWTARSMRTINGLASRLTSKVVILTPEPDDRLDALLED